MSIKIEGKEVLVIGLCGAKTSGKSYVAGILEGLVSELYNAYHKQSYLKIMAERISFAEPLKDMIAVGLGLDKPDTEEEVNAPTVYGPSYRTIIQTLGTEWGRGLVAKDLWIQVMKENIKECASFPEPTEVLVIIIDDVRFEDEAALILDYYQGSLVHLVNPDDPDGPTDSPLDTHASELGLPVEQLSRARYYLNSKLLYPPNTEELINKQLFTPLIDNVITGLLS